MEITVIFFLNAEMFQVWKMWKYMIRNIDYSKFFFLIKIQAVWLFQMNADGLLQHYHSFQRLIEENETW